MSDLWLWIQAICTFGRDATFNYALWQFAWTYYTISRYTPLMLKQETPSEKTVKFDNKIRLIFSVANILVPFLLGATLLAINLKICNSIRSNMPSPEAPIWGASNFLALYLDGVFQMVSLGFFAYAVFKIKGHIQT